MSKPIQQGITFFKDDAEITARETLYRGSLSPDLYCPRHRLFSGGMNGEVTREIFERGHITVLLPFDPVRDGVVLVEQTRIVTHDTSESPWLLETVAGMIEAGETMEDVARQEVLEEAGLGVRRMKPILSYLAGPGGASERLSVLVGEIDTSTAKGIHDLVEKNEDTRVHVVNQEQAYQWVEEGKINSTTSVIALQWLQLHYHNL